MEAKTYPIGLLDFIAHRVPCEYLSDLHWKHQLLPDIQRVIQEIPLAQYDLREWNDAVQYVTGLNRSFESKQEAYDFLLSFDISESSGIEP